jgi:DNA-directed RNA polymerase specialized sigma subunit
MKQHACDADTPNRLDHAMASLDPLSRKVMQLWLKGLDRTAIASEMGLGEEIVSTVSKTAYESLQRALA